MIFEVILQVRNKEMIFEVSLQIRNVSGDRDGEKGK